MSAETEREDAMQRLKVVVAFLTGSGPLDGLYFGDYPPLGEGRYWWRKQLREAINDLEAALRARPAVQSECLCPGPSSWPIVPDCPLHGPLVERPAVQSEPEPVAWLVEERDSNGKWWPATDPYNTKYLAEIARERRPSTRRTVPLFRCPAVASATDDISHVCFIGEHDQCAVMVGPEPRAKCPCPCHTTPVSRTVVRAKKLNDQSEEIAVLKDKLHRVCSELARFMWEKNYTIGEIHERVSPFSETYTTRKDPEPLVDSGI